MSVSTDDVVCTGWLIKSPPEKKLNTRYSWRKRWFVLRQGRMSGNPDVLEYYRTKSSRKPIRTIDLQECEVLTHGEPQQHLHKRPFQNQHLFVVKTSARVFYLLAKTQEEMNSWVQSISQICTFSVPDDTDSADSLSHTSQQPSPAVSPRASLVSPGDGGAVMGSRERVPESEGSSPPHYLILSQCNTGTVTRSNSFTNSELSLEQSSSEMAAEDTFSSPLSTSTNGGPPPSVTSPHLLLSGHHPHQHHPHHLHYQHPHPHHHHHHHHPTSTADAAPFSAPCGPTPLCPSSSCTSASVSSSSSPRSLQQLPSVFSFDRPFCPTNASSNGSSASVSDPHTPHSAHTPPPLPPKPTHFSDGATVPPPPLLRHRVSLPCLDFRRGEPDSLARRRNKMASLHLSSLAAGGSLSCPPPSSDDSYVPMASPPVSAAMDDVASDGYIPMSPASFPVARNAGKAEAPLPAGADLEPPPVNRELKPKLRRARPPPLDLRGLSTIREHLPLVRMHTEPSSGHPCMAAEQSRRLRALTPADPEALATPTERQPFFPVGGEQPWRGSRLDYIAVDFNSASPSPVLKKPLLSEEHRVDYVQVDKKKTQALFELSKEWQDVRQSQA
ncbi:GRB2-associated-binding protein 3 isoform X2 [Engraulis encrasicolus]|uniref:GRB2-associated-binding protein 3 isoform X2 n=1 Tax=Engraulis encrasicolus TaxID=184585 RepID=UPI002FD3AD63